MAPSLQKKASATGIHLHYFGLHYHQIRPKCASLHPTNTVRLHKSHRLDRFTKSSTLNTTILRMFLHSCTCQSPESPKASVLFPAYLSTPPPLLLNEFASQQWGPERMQSYFSNKGFTCKWIVQDQSQMFGTPSQSKHRPEMSRDLTSAPFKMSQCPFLPPIPPSLRVSLQHDKVKQTPGPWQRCPGFCEVLIGWQLASQARPLGLSEEWSTNKHRGIHFHNLLIFK